MDICRYYDNPVVNKELCVNVGPVVNKLCLVLYSAVYPLISRRRFQQLEVLEGQNILVTISGKKNKIRVYYLSWLKTKILKTDAVSNLLHLGLSVVV